MIKVKVHGSIIRKRLHCGLYDGTGRMVARRKPLLSQKNMTPQHSFTEQHQTNDKTSGIITFGQKRPKWRCLTRMHSALFGEKQTHSILAQTPHTNCQAQWWKYNGLGLSNSLSLAKTRESATTITTQTNLQYNSWIYLLQINLPAKYLPGLSLINYVVTRNPAFFPTNSHSKALVQGHNKWDFTLLP